MQAGKPLAFLFACSYDVFDIQHLAPTSKERFGYPTQKPLALLERIINVSSNEGDIVADFFCGCGTTITAAEQLGRKWLGVDINHLAIGLIEEQRLLPLRAHYHVQGFPKDCAQAYKLAREQPFAFESWIVEYVFKGHAAKKTRDSGFSGHIVLNIAGVSGKRIGLLEVKGGGCTVKNIREFHAVIQQHNADIGMFICFHKEVTAEMKKYCDHQGYLESEETLVGIDKIPCLSIITIEDILEQNLPHWLLTPIKNVTY